MIVDDGAGLRRVQCKFTSTDQVALRRIHSSAKGYVVKFTREGAYDWLYILQQDGREYLVKACLAGWNAWTLRDESRIGTASEKALFAPP